MLKPIVDEINAHPILLFVLLSFVFLLIWALIPNKVKIQLGVLNKKVIFGVSCLLILNYILLVASYASHSNFIDHFEVQIATVSWFFQIGKPVYHGLESAERYSGIYGPLLYIINGFFLSLFGPSIVSAKIAGVLAAILSLVFVFYTLKKVSGTRIAIICCGYISLTLLSIQFFFLGSSFWVRSDPLILMFVALALLGAVRTGPLTATLLCTLSLGVTINLKLSCALYFLPIYILLYSQAGVYYTLASILGSIAIAFAPFLLQQVSIGNYLLWLSEAGKHGLGARELVQNAEWTLYFLLPIIILSTYMLFTNPREFEQVRYEQRKYIYALVISLVGVGLIGSKRASGMNHLIPFLPLFAYLFVLIINKRITGNGTSSKAINNKYFQGAIISAALALFTTTLMRVAMNEPAVINLAKKDGYKVINDIENIVKTHPGSTIGMGYGQDYELTWYRPTLVYSGNPYLVDSGVLMDYEASGIKMPTKTLEALSSCQTKIWLIPKGNSPFQMMNFYPPNPPLFSQEFIDTFLKSYTLKEQTAYYDLWFCKQD